MKNQKSNTSTALLYAEAVAIGAIFIVSCVGIVCGIVSLIADGEITWPLLIGTVVAVIIYAAYRINVSKFERDEETWIPSGRVSPNAWRNNKTFFMSDLDDWF